MLYEIPEEMLRLSYIFLFDSGAALCEIIEETKEVFYVEASLRAVQDCRGDCHCWGIELGVGGDSRCEWGGEILWSRNRDHARDLRRDRSFRIDAFSKLLHGLSSL